MASEEGDKDGRNSPPRSSSSPSTDAPNTHLQDVSLSHQQLVSEEHNRDGRQSAATSPLSKDVTNYHLQEMPHQQLASGDQDKDGRQSAALPSKDVTNNHLQDMPHQQPVSGDQDKDGRQSAALPSSVSSSSTPASTVVISSLPDEILIYHILPLFTIYEIEPLKLVCQKWLGYVRQYYGQLKVLDLTPWDYMVDEKVLFRIIKYAVQLREIRLDRCWKGVTVNSVVKMSTHCPQLRVFCASRCGSLTDCAITALVEECSQLTELDLSSCYRITDESLCSIATHAKNLRELHVSSVYGVTDYGVSQLSYKCLSLKNLDVSYCYRVSGAGLEGFLKRSSEQMEKDLVLKYLRIKDCQQVTDVMVAQLISVGIEVNNMF